MDEVRQAWNQGQVPIADAVTFGDGRMVLLDVLHVEDGGTMVVRPLAESTYGSFLTYNPGWLADVTPLAEIQLPSGGLLQSGEGSHGGDGFISLSDQSGELVYCVFCTSSNPFTELAMSEDRSRVRAVTSNGVEWSFDLDTPWKIDTRRSSDR